MLKPLLFVSALVLLGISSSSNAGPLPQEKTQPVVSGTQLSDKVLAHTKELYGQECALCHGATGNGKSDVATAAKMALDDWTDPKSLAGKSDTELFNLIRSGKGQMPAEPAGRAKDAEVRDMILYIRSLAQQPPAAAPATPPTAN
jgi:mono/diheme cytochrome c family protein